MSTEDARKLFVAGLPDTIAEDILRQLFEATGGAVVDVSIPRDRATGRPRGFGFVTLATSDEAMAARGVLDGSVQAGRAISVRPFQAEPPRRDTLTPGPRPSTPSMAPAPDRTLYVGNLPYDATEQDVEQLLARAGTTAVRINLPMDPDGRKRGFGFVTMDSAESARQAMEALRGLDMRGRKLVVNIAHPKGDRPARENGVPSSARPTREPLGAPGPAGDRPARPAGFGAASPPPDQSRRTFDEGRRRAAKPESEVDRGGARKRPRVKERNRRVDWRDDYYDDDE